ncbi:MAG: hypothetical protein ACRENV_01310 [Candidatus Dormibacteria bacterium]
MSESGVGHTGVISNTAAAAGNSHLLARYQAAGRQTGYLASYIRQTSPQQAVGPVLIESTAARFGSAAGATQGVQLASDQLRQAGYRAISTGRVGDHTAGFFSERSSAGTTYESFVVVWTEANVVNLVQAAGNAATMDLSYALGLARRQQANEAAG